MQQLLKFEHRILEYPITIDNRKWVIRQLISNLHATLKHIIIWKLNVTGKHWRREGVLALAPHLYVCITCIDIFWSAEATYYVPWHFQASWHLSNCMLYYYVSMFYGSYFNVIQDRLKKAFSDCITLEYSSLFHLINYTHLPPHLPKQPWTKTVWNHTRSKKNWKISSDKM